MQSEPAPLDRIRIPREAPLSNISIAENTPPAARNIARDMGSGLVRDR